MRLEIQESDKKGDKGCRYLTCGNYSLNKYTIMEGSTIPNRLVQDVPNRTDGLLGSTPQFEKSNKRQIGA